MKLGIQNLNLKLLLLFLVSFIGAKSFSQIDSRSINAERRIGAENRSIESSNRNINAERQIDQGLSTGERPKFLLGEPDAPLLDVNPNKSKTLDMTEQSEYITRTIKFKPGYIQGSKGRDGRIYEEFSKPQDLGSYRTKGKFVKVSWRDAQVVDGDRVDIMVNGEVVVRNVTLLAQYHSIILNLDEGFTKIEIKALNMGESGPNTAEFKVEDENGRILTHDQWNLTTGTIAHMVVIKE